LGFDERRLSYRLRYTCYVMFLKQQSRSYYNNLNRAKPECYTIVMTQTYLAKKQTSNLTEGMVDIRLTRQYIK